MVDWKNETKKYSGLCNGFVDIMQGARAKKWCILKILQIQSVPPTYHICHFAKVTVRYLNAFLSYSLNFMSKSLIEWVVSLVTMEIMTSISF